MSDNIASIYLDVNLNTSKLQKDLLALEKQKISINVNDASLTNLNKHLDLKVSHYKQVQNFFNSNALKIKVDDSALTKLNNTFTNFQKQAVVFPIEIDDRKIISALNDIKKTFQAQTFKTNIAVDTQSLTNQIAESIRNVSSDKNLAINLKLKEGDRKSPEYRELSVGIKQVERAVRENTARSTKGVLGNVLTGIQEQIGSSLVRDISMGFKDVFGKDAGISARKVSKSAAKFTKETFFDNAEFITAANDAQKILEVRLRKAGYSLGDAIVAGLEDTGGIESKLNSFTKNLFENVNFSVVGDELSKELVEFKSKLQEALLPATALNKVFAPVANNLNAYREVALQERAIPLVKQRALDVLAQKRAKNSAKVVDETTKELFITSGGYAGARGLSGERLAKEINQQKVEGRQAIWIKNSDSDLPKESMSKASDKLLALLTSLGKPNLRGYSKDAVEIASQALAAHERNPEITIKILGESGGGFAAEEASKILDMLGIKNTFLGVGTPNFIGGFDRKDRKIISPDEHLGYETHKTYQRLGLANNSKSQNILGVQGHPYENYRNAGVAELQNFLHGSPGQMTPELLADFKKGAEFFKSQDTSKLESRQIEQLADAAFKNMQHIRRFLLESTDEFKEELQIVVNDFENSFATLSPDSKNVEDIKKSLIKANELLKHLENQPGIEASLVASSIAKELEATQKQADALFKNSVGTEKLKAKGLSEEVAKTRKNLLDPKLGIKLQPLKIESPKPLEVQKVVELAPIQQEIKATTEELTKFTEEAVQAEVEKVKNIVNNFKKNYEDFKAALKKTKKTGDKVPTKLVGDKVLQDAPMMRALINTSKEQIALGGFEKSPAIDSLNQQLALIKRYENTVTREYTVNKIALPNVNAAKSVGANLPNALGKGINQESEKPIEAVADMAEGVIKKAEEVFEIESPSKIFVGIGEFIAQGLNLGVSEIQNIPLASYFKKLIGSGTSGIQGLFKGFNDSTNEGVKNLITGLSTLAGGFLVITKGLPQLSQFVSESLQVSTEMENINRQLTFSAGGGVQGAKILTEIRKATEDLKLNIRDTMQSAAGFLASTEGTVLEGQAGVDTFKNFQKLLRVRGGDNQSQQRALVAIQQMAGKGVIQAEELRGQLAEALPGSVNLFARSQGLTTEQLNRRMKPGGTPFTSEALVAFGQQAAIESSSGLGDSLNTAQAASDNFNNSLLKLQETIGNVLLPFQKGGLNAIAGFFDFASSQVIGLLQGFALMAVKLSWEPILKPLFVGIWNAVKGFDILNIKALGTGAAIKTAFAAAKVFVAEMLLIHTVVELATTLKNVFTDLSGEIGKVAKDGGRDLAELKKSLENNSDIKLNVELPKNAFDKFVSGIKNNPLDIINPFGASNINRRAKAQGDTRNAINDTIKNAQEFNAIAKSSKIDDSINNTAEIDRKLKVVRANRQALTLLNPEDTRTLKTLVEEEQNLVKIRYESLKPAATLQGMLEKRIKDLKLAQTTLEEQKNSGGYLESDYLKQTQEINDQLKELENQQDRITKAIGKTANAFDVLKVSLQDINAKFEDAKTNTEDLATISKTKITKSNLNESTKDYLTRGVDLQTLQRQRKNTESAIKGQQALLSAPEASNILNALGIDKNTGIARINQLKESLSNDNDKFILEQFANLQTNNRELINLRSQIVQAQNQFRLQLIEQTKQVQEYYKNISRNFQETTIEISKLSLQTKNTQISSKLRESLSNGYETIIGTLVSGIEEALNSFTSAADKALDSQKDLLTTQFNIQDSTRSGIELSKTIPSVQVGLDFSSIPNDSNITQLRDEIDSTIGGTEELGNSINLSINSADDLGKSFESLINPLLENDKQTQEIFKNLTNSENTTDKIADSTNQWNDNLKNVTPQVESINSGFNGLLDSLTNIFLKTNEWLAGLLKAPEILQGIVNNVSQTPFVQGLQQIGNGILNTNNSDVSYGKIIEPVDRKRYPITSGFGNRIIFGKSDFHEGLDYGTPIGTPIKSPVSGKVTHAGALGTAGITVKIAGVDSQGRKTEDMLLHLSEALVKVGDVIQQGQVVAKSGNTGRGTGAHLDWRRKVNGQYENPEVSLRTSAHLPVKTIISNPKDFKPSLQNSSVSAGSNTNASGISRGGNLLNPSEIAKLTPLGKQLYAFQQNPKVLAFADVVARAEGTDFRNGSKNFGYSMMIGGEHDTDFSRHPFAGNQGRSIRPARHNSTASGRYQAMNFNYSKTQVARQFGKGAQSIAGMVFQGENPGSFSPAVQDLMFLASLKDRGVLDEVLKGDFQSALSNPNIAKHYASLQSGNSRSAYGGQGTPEGQLRNTIPFAQQRLQARLQGDSKPLIQSPGSLQSQIVSGTQLSIQSLTQKSQATQANIEVQRKRDILNGETALNKVKRQTERVVRESQDKLQSNARALTDAKFDSVPFPTVEQQNKKASTDILRKKQDTLKQFQRDLEDAKKAVFEADKFIKNSSELLAGETDVNIQKTLNVGITESKKLREVKLKEIADINSKIVETSKAFDAQESARFDKANFEEYLRSSKSAIELQTQENAGLQERIASLEKIKEISPTDPRAEMLPELKKQLAFQQLEIETATKLLDIEEKIKKSGNDPKITSELQKQLVALESQNDAKVRTIQLTHQQAIQEAERAKILRDFDIRSKVADIENQFADNGVKFTQRINSKDAFGVDTGNLTKARINFAQVQTTLANLDLEKNIRDIQEFGKREGLAANQVNTFVENFKTLNDIKLTNIKNELDDLINSDNLAELQKVRENLQTQFNLKEQPRLDLVNAKADRFERIGGNVFVANKMRRDAAKESELFARDQALKNLDEQVEQARTRGITVTDAEVSNLRNNLIQLSELKLDGLTNQFKDVSTTLGDIVKQGLTSFSQGIADLITKGGSLEDVFDNLFSSILNSVINMGLNSLMSGLLGGGGLFSGLFYAGKLPKNYASGGVPIHPQSLNNALRRERMMSGRNAQIGIVHENELIIPAHRVESLNAMGLSPEALLGRNFANGQIPSGVRSGLTERRDTSTINVKTQVINKVEYVDMEQFQQGLNEAAKRGASQGAKQVQLSLQNSSSYRSSVGL
jgi:tape measure domain-containing protein